MIYDTEIREKLRIYLNREPTENEVQNSKKDRNILCLIMDDKVFEAEARIAELEKKVKKLEKPE